MCLLCELPSDAISYVLNLQGLGESRRVCAREILLGWPSA